MCYHTCALFPLPCPTLQAAMQRRADEPLRPFASPPQRHEAERALQGAFFRAGVAALPPAGWEAAIYVAAASFSFRSAVEPGAAAAEMMVEDAEGMDETGSVDLLEGEEEVESVDLMEVEEEESGSVGFADSVSGAESVDLREEGVAEEEPATEDAPAAGEEPGFEEEEAEDYWEGLPIGVVPLDEDEEEWSDRWSQTTEELGRPRERHDRSRW